MMRLALIPIVAALVLASVASAATSDTTIVTATIGAGPAVGVSASGSGFGFGLTLNGVDQATTYTLPLVVTDATGSGAGWNLTITSTTFTDPGAHTFPTNASTITGATSGCATGSTCTLPTNGVSNSSLALPAGSPAPSAVKFFNAASATGRGTINVTPTVRVAVPANVLAGAYTSTVTIAAVSGP